ncbi:ATP-binding protein [Streptomyces goshikiensis]|uniref:ATP-binding protein n=1 Tax=Streptomyces goshikiensis TaxID=1942 RepID=UPI00364C3F4E
MNSALAQGITAAVREANPLVVPLPAVREEDLHDLRVVLREVLKVWSCAGRSGDAELVLTELLANVIRHVPSSSCTLMLERHTWGVRLSVADSFAQVPALSEPRLSFNGEAGRGLCLIAAFSDDFYFDTYSDRTGKRAIADFRCAA